MKDNDGAYWIGLLCSMLGLGLLGFMLYVAPVIFWGVHFDVPEFVIRLQHWYQHHHNLTGTLTALMLFLPIIIAIIVLFFIARRIDTSLSPEIDNTTVLPKSIAEAGETLEELAPELEQLPPSRRLSSNARILIFIAIVLIVLVIAEITLFFDILE